MERQRLWDEQMMTAQAQGMPMPGNNNNNGVGGLPSHHMDLAGAAPAGNGVGMGQNNGGGFSWPAALLAQHPALQTIQWDQLGPGPGGVDDAADLSGRSSFDAGSGGDYFDEDDEAGYVSGPGTGFGQHPSGWGIVGEAQDWASDYEGR